MKKVLSVLVAVLLIAIACVPAFAATQQATISATDTAAVGDTITVSVVSPAGLNGLSVNFTYDTAYFTLVSYEATGLYGSASVNSPSAGMVKFAGVGSSVAGGTAFTVTLKVKKTGGTVRTAVTDALDASDSDVTASFSAATKTIAAGTTTTKATTAKVTTTKAGATTAAAGKNPSIPKTGGSVSVVASSAAVLVMAAAVAYTMKKKNNEE